MKQESKKNMSQKEMFIIVDNFLIGVKEKGQQQKELIVPDGVRVIGNSKLVFYRCLNLVSVVLSKGLKTIDDYAFHSCDKLTSINFPEGLKLIGIGAFGWCYSLEEIKLPDSISEIGKWAFGGCKSLVKVKLPDCAVKLGEHCFACCYSLREIRLPDRVRFAGLPFRSCKNIRLIVSSEEVKKRVMAENVVDQSLGQEVVIEEK